MYWVYTYFIDSTLCFISYFLPWRTVMLPLLLYIVSIRYYVFVCPFIFDFSQTFCSRRISWKQIYLDLAWRKNWSEILSLNWEIYLLLFTRKMETFGLTLTSLVGFLFLCKLVFTLSCSDCVFFTVILFVYWFEDYICYSYSSRAYAYF